MKQSIYEKYSELSREEIIEKCEMYRRQVGGMAKRPNQLKQKLKFLESENAFLRKTLSRLFDEYVKSHTVIDINKNESISPLEQSVLKQFETILDSLNIEHIDIPDTIK